MVVVVVGWGGGAHASARARAYVQQGCGRLHHEEREKVLTRHRSALAAQLVPPVHGAEQQPWAQQLKAHLRGVAGRASSMAVSAPSGRERQGQNRIVLHDRI